MKFLAKRYIYPLVVISLVVSVILQAAWLRQLFFEQRQRSLEELQTMVTLAARNNMYASAVPDGSSEDLYHDFLLTPEWIQIRQGFDDAITNNLGKSFFIHRSTDSAVIELRLVFWREPDKHRTTAYSSSLRSLKQTQLSDSMSLYRMKQAVEAGLAKIGLHSEHFHRIFKYSKNSPGTEQALPKVKAIFTSLKHSYNLDHLHKYQLVVTSVNALVWFKMRFYLGSSFLMIILTFTAFYIILKLMRDQRLYAEARVAFTSNMTHEIKTPIATVSLALESITRYHLTDDPEKLQSYLDISRQELHRLNLMVEKVLNLSQETTDYPLNRTLIDVQPSLLEVIRSMDLQLAKAGAACEFKASTEPCFVYADSVHLTGVFYNLIENAIKYGDKTLRLVIKCEHRDKQIHISFSDNGPGIPAIYQDKIFERFFRVPTDGDIHNIKGSGLGLSYVRQIIKAHGGDISVASEAGRGSKFSIFLPVSYES